MFIERAFYRFISEWYPVFLCSAIILSISSRSVVIISPMTLCLIAAMAFPYSNAFLQKMILTTARNHTTTLMWSTVSEAVTDFDGIEGKFEIADCTDMKKLFDALQKKGFSEDALEKIAYKNVERVIREVMWENVKMLTPKSAYKLQHLVMK